MTRIGIYLLLIGVVCVVLFGCDADPYWDKRAPLTNEQIVAVQDYCHSHNMLAWVRSNNHGETVKVECYVRNRSDETNNFPRPPK